MIKFKCFNCSHTIVCDSLGKQIIAICDNCKQGYKVKNFKNGKSTISVIPTIKIKECGQEEK